MDDVIFSVFPSENFIDLNLYQSGREICKPGHIFGPARRNHYLFHYVISGGGTLIAQGSDGKDQTFSVGPKQGFLMFPDQICTYIADLNDPWVYEWIEFDGLRVNEALEQTYLSRDNPVYRSHTPEQRDKMYEELDHIVMHASREYPLTVMGHVFLFVGALVLSARKKEKPKGSRLAEYYVHEAVSFIENNYQKSVSVEDIAQSLGIERSYFGKLFKRIMGKSPQQFLITYRLVKAATLLKSTDLAIKDICVQVGYDSQLHFSRAFKKVYGKSPSEWRSAS